MNTQIVNQKGFKEIVAVTILIIAVSLLTFIKKELFVHESGTMQVYGSIGVLLAFGLLLKWKYARPILLFITGFWIIVTFFSGRLLFMEEDIDRAINNLILGGILIVIFLLLISKPLKTFQTKT